MAGNTSDNLYISSIKSKNTEDITKRRL
jgi:hypothetical protein